VAQKINNINIKKKVEKIKFLELFALFSGKENKGKSKWRDRFA